MGVCAVVIGGVDGVIGRAAIGLGEVEKDAHGGGVCGPIAVPDVIHGGRAEHDWPAVIANALANPQRARLPPPWRHGEMGRRRWFAKQKYSLRFAPELGQASGKKHTTHSTTFVEMTLGRALLEWS